MVLIYTAFSIYASTFSSNLELEGKLTYNIAV